MSINVQLSKLSTTFIFCGRQYYFVFKITIKHSRGQRKNKIFSVTFFHHFFLILSKGEKQYSPSSLMQHSLNKANEWRVNCKIFAKLEVKSALSNYTGVCVCVCKANLSTTASALYYRWVQYHCVILTLQKKERGIERKENHMNNWAQIKFCDPPSLLWSYEVSSGFSNTLLDQSEEKTGP